MQTSIHLRNVQRVKDFLRMLKVDRGAHWSGCYLAGGACRTMLTNEPVVDFDLFFESKEAAADMESFLQSQKNCCEMYRCKGGELVTLQVGVFKIQLITKTFHPNVEHLLERFDFTICKFGMDLNTGMMTYSRKDEEDLFNKTLRINNLQYPVATLHRVQKYLAKGYKPEDWQEFWADILTRASNIELTEENLALYID